jgi:hypothetical protein
MMKTINTNPAALINTLIEHTWENTDNQEEVWNGQIISYDSGVFQVIMTMTVQNPRPSLPHSTRRTSGINLRPVLFNIFINDIFHFIPDSSLYNYADDNTLLYSGYDLDKIINTLENAVSDLTHCFLFDR